MTKSEILEDGGLSVASNGRWTPRALLLEQLTAIIGRKQNFNYKISYQYKNKIIFIFVVILLNIELISVFELKRRI